jgi:hypothetical protein
LVVAFAWLLPTSSLKTWALRKLGNDISDDAIIGPTSSSAVAGSASAKAR